MLNLTPAELGADRAWSSLNLSTDDKWFRTKLSTHDVVNTYLSK